MEEVTQREVVYIIADTETTGLTGPACEIALREIDPDTLETVWELDSLIDPECEIEPRAMEIHGITQEMVADEPTLAEFIEHRLGDRYADQDVILICHNISFDEKRLRSIFNITRGVCTLFHSRLVWPKGSQIESDGPVLENHQLGTLREWHGFPKNEAHRALADVATTHRLLREIVAKSGRTLQDFVMTQETTVHRMPWGAHAGKLLVQIPAHYMQWMWDREDLEPNLRKSLESAMKIMNVAKPKKTKTTPKKEENA